MPDVIDVFERENRYSRQYYPTQCHWCRPFLAIEVSSPQGGENPHLKCETPPRWIAETTPALAVVYPNRGRELSGNRPQPERPQPLIGSCARWIVIGRNISVVVVIVLRGEGRLV